MPKRSSRKRGKQGPEDANEAAFRVTKEATEEAPPEPEREKNPAAVALGKLGGAKGGKARAAKLTPEKRSEIARRAATARWSRRSA
jgi:hypothetical protein